MSTIPELMHAIRAMHNDVAVTVGIHLGGWAYATTSGLPKGAFDDGEFGTYPNCGAAVNGYLSVYRYDDDDVLAALQTAHDFIAARLAEVDR